MLISFKHAGIDVVKALEDRFDRKAWNRFLRDCLASRGRACIMLGKSQLQMTTQSYTVLKDRFADPRATLGMIAIYLSLSVLDTPWNQDLRWLHCSRNDMKTLLYDCRIICTVS